MLTVHPFTGFTNHRLRCRTRHFAIGYVWYGMKGFLVAEARQPEVADGLASEPRRTRSPRTEIDILTDANPALAGRRWQWLRRLQAAAFDFPIIVGWLVLAGAIGALLRLLDLGFDTAAAWDVFALVTVVLPVLLTFAIVEASPSQATPGKRRLSLAVVDRDGARLTRGRSLARSAIKFAPWQMAHTAVFQLLAGNTAVGYGVLAVVAQVLVVASIVTMAIDARHRSFHDLIAGTQVVHEERREEAALAPSGSR